VPAPTCFEAVICLSAPLFTNWLSTDWKVSASIVLAAIDFAIALGSFVCELLSPSAIVAVAL